VVRFVITFASLRALAFRKRASVFWFSDTACDACRNGHDEWPCDISYATGVDTSF